MARKKKAEKVMSQTTYEKLQELASKARVEVEKILKIVGKEAGLGSKVLKGRIDILNLDTKIDNKYRELGKETYNLIQKGVISDSKLKSIVDEINGYYDALGEKRGQVGELQQEMKKAVKS